MEKGKHRHRSGKLDMEIAKRFRFQPINAIIYIRSVNPIKLNILFTVIAVTRLDTLPRNQCMIK